jgi:hypothetical protein
MACSCSSCKASYYDALLERLRELRHDWATWKLTNSMFERFFSEVFDADEQTPEWLDSD